MYVRVCVSYTHVCIPQCMAVYAALKIREGDYVVECPDANCDCSGELTLEEMESLVGSKLYQLHLKFRKNTGECCVTHMCFFHVVMGCAS